VRLRQNNGADILGLSLVCETGLL